MRYKKNTCTLVTIFGEVETIILFILRFSSKLINPFLILSTISL